MSNTIRILKDMCDDNIDIIQNIFCISKDDYKLIYEMLEETKNNNNKVIVNVINLKNSFVHIDLNPEITKLLQRLKNCNNFLKAITSEYSFYDTFIESKCNFCYELKEINTKKLGICKKCFDKFDLMSVKDKMTIYFDNFTI